MKVLHVGHFDKFTFPLWTLLQNSLDMSDQIFLFRRKVFDGDIDNKTSETGTLLIWASKLVFRAHCSEKIILHGLLDRFVIIALFFQPWLLKKCYWVIWGGDLYYYKHRKRGPWPWLFEQLRRRVLGRVGHLVTYIEGDVALARDWYGNLGEHHECLAYLSNIFQERQIYVRQSGTTNLLVGNSATPTNNHKRIFDALSVHRHEDIRIFCPLSYGVELYAEQTAGLGADIFGDKFFPLHEFMPYEEYLDVLNSIDIGIFSHERQQGMGSLITLLGFGKKVYIRRDVVQWSTFKRLGLKVFDIEELDISKIDQATAEINIGIIREHFSEQVLLEQWAVILS